MKWDPNRGEWKREVSGPPDLEAWIKGLFQDKSQSPGTGLKGHDFRNKNPYLFVAGIFCLLILYIISGFYLVRESERGVCLRFGRVFTEVGPGLHWRARGIDNVHLVDVRAISSFKKESTMLTEDENIVYAGVEIQYRRHDPMQYLFGDAYPILTLQQLSESCIRDVIGHSSLDEILTAGKHSITLKIQELIIQSLTFYKLGIEVLDVNLSFVLPPEPVQAAFNDVIRAREDEQAYQNEALRYRENQIPVAQSQANRLIFEATAYREEKILAASAEVRSFILLADQEQKYPEITRSRLTFEAMEDVLKNQKKIIIDSKCGATILSLPALLDQASVDDHLKLRGAGL